MGMHDDEGDRGKVRHTESDADPASAARFDACSSPGSDADPAARRDATRLGLRPHAGDPLRGEAGQADLDTHGSASEPDGAGGSGRGANPTAGSDDDTAASRGSSGGGDGSTSYGYDDARPANSHSGSAHGDPNRADGRSKGGAAFSILDTHSVQGDTHGDTHDNADRNADPERVRNSHTGWNARQVLRRRGRTFPPGRDLDSHGHSSSQAPFLE